MAKITKVPGGFAVSHTTREVFGVDDICERCGADHNGDSCPKAVLPRTCVACGYGEDEHKPIGRFCPEQKCNIPLKSFAPRTTFEPVPCVLCGDPALGGLKSAPRCEWCLAGPKGLAEVLGFVIHARDYISAQASGIYFRVGHIRAVRFLDHAADHLRWLLATNRQGEKTRSNER